MGVSKITRTTLGVHILRIEILLGLYLDPLNPKPYKRIASECPLVLPARQCCKEGLLCPQLTLAIHITHCGQYRVLGFRD